MTNRKSEVSFDFAFVEDRIFRAERLLRKLVRVNRRNAAVKAKAFDRGIGQIIPGTDAFIGQMIDFPSAWFYPRQKLKNTFGEISGIAGAADLIENDFQFRPFERQHPYFLSFLMPIDINLLRVSRGGNPELVRQSQRNRFASVELVDEVIALDDVSSLYSVSWNRSGEASLV